MAERAAIGVESGGGDVAGVVDALPMPGALVAAARSDSGDAAGLRVVHANGGARRMVTEGPGWPFDAALREACLRVIGSGPAEELDGVRVARAGACALVTWGLMAGSEERERRAAADAARDRERFRLAAEAVNGIIYEYEVETGRVTRSRGLLEVVGYRPEEVPATAAWWAGQIHPEDLPRAAAAFDEHECRGDVCFSEYRVRHRDGRWLHVEDRALISRDAAGRPVGLVGCTVDVTERKRAEAALREGEERLRIATGAAGLGVFEWRVDGDVAVWENDRIYEIFGRTRAQGPLGKEAFFRDALDPRDRAAVEAEMARAAAGSGTLRARYRVRRGGDGATRWIDCSARFTFGPGGAPERLVGVLADVTELVDAEAALRGRNELLELAQRAGSVGFFDYRFREDRSTWSGGLASLFGIAPGEYEGTWEGWARRVVPEDAAEVRRVCEEAAARGDREVSYEFRAVLPDGTRRWLAGRGQIDYAGDGAPERMTGVNIDVTRRKFAEEAVRRKDAELSLCLRTGAMGTWHFDHRTMRVQTSGVTDELFGLAPAGPWEGRELEEYMARVHPEDRDELRERTLAAAREGTELRVEYRVVRDDGTERWVSSRGDVLRDERGEPTRMVGALMDVTERKRAEAELVLHRERLEQLVEERTAELEASRQRLRISERLASLGTLSAGLGHDMGNLLVPLRVRLESLSALDLPGEAREDLAAIRGSADYLQRLASGLRMLSIDPGRSRIGGVGGAGWSGEPTEIRAWMSEAGTVLKNVLPRGVTLSTSLPEGEVWACVPRASLMQAVFNLVQNAGDAMRSRGHGRVSVEVERGGDAVRVRVVDDGPGMTEEVRRRCMEPFFTTKTRGMSTGLGLALVYGLVRDAGGQVLLETEEGRGTAFTLVLRPASAPGSGEAGPRRVAVVEIADARLRAIVSAELRGLSYEVRSGSAAAVEGAGADLAVVDRAGAFNGPAREVIALTEPSSAPPSARPLGARPRLQEIRAALRAAGAGGVADEGPVAMGGAGSGGP